MPHNARYSRLKSIECFSSRGNNNGSQSAWRNVMCGWVAQFRAILHVTRTLELFPLFLPPLGLGFPLFVSLLRSTSTPSLPPSITVPLPGRSLSQFVLVWNVERSAFPGFADRFSRESRHEDGNGFLVNKSTARGGEITASHLIFLLVSRQIVPWSEMADMKTEALFLFDILSLPSSCHVYDVIRLCALSSLMWYENSRRGWRYFPPSLLLARHINSTFRVA